MSGPLAEQPLRRIAVVGGGTAGWMAAIMLNRHVRGNGTAVTLVEAPTIETIGVGEATIPTLVHFVRLMQFDEAEFMRRTSATIKLGIRFENWQGEGTHYWHPFGFGGPSINNADLFHYWLKREQDFGQGRPFAAYAPQIHLAEARRAPFALGGTSTIQAQGSYAYHLDAAGLADFLRISAVGEGVTHIFGEVSRVGTDSGGDIARLELVGGSVVEADLYIDATGFAALLAGRALGDPWIDWSDQLLCDRAVVMPLQRDESFPPYTRSIAEPAGWRWQIPLSSRTGTGYVYSSRHVSDDEAEAALVAAAGFRRSRTADPRRLTFRTGRRSRFWSRNCVALGLAAGFVEPLESTGIHLIQRGVEHLLAFLPGLGDAGSLRRAYNARMAALFDDVRDFILAHYLVTRRDEPFWRDARMVELPESLKENLALYDSCGRVELGPHAVFREQSYQYVLSAGGRLPRRPSGSAAMGPIAELPRILDGIHAREREEAARMPSHAGFVADLHRSVL